MKRRVFARFVIWVFSFLIMQESLAHSVYFQQIEGNRIIIRFGEFGADHEESPGYLDSLDAVSAWKYGVDNKLQLLDLEKKKQGFAVKASAEDSIAAQTGFPVMSRGGNPSRKPNFYARWIPGFGKKLNPSLNLDIVPTGKSSQVQIFFRGKPLADVEVKLYAPDVTEQAYTSDKNGLVKIKIDPDKKGLYMLKVARYSETLQGYDRGRGYAVTSHNCSLTWSKSE